MKRRDETVTAKKKHLNGDIAVIRSPLTVIRFSNRQWKQKVKTKGHPLRFVLYDKIAYGKNAHGALFSDFPKFRQISKKRTVIFLGATTQNTNGLCQ